MMKARIFVIISMAIALLSLSVNVHGQAPANFNATATIVTPIAISVTTHMNFGNIAVSSTAGTVVLTPAGGRTPTGGVTLPATPGTVSAAVFAVSGTPGYTYAITLPAGSTVSSGGNNMNIDTFTSNPNNTGTLDGSGAQTLQVGATLHVSANQPSGIYTSATPFTVTVNYN